MLDAGDEGHIVNTTSHNGGLVPIPDTPQYATCKSAIVTVSECLWSQLQAAGAPIGVSVLFPSGRTPGLLNTGIWRRRDRPAEFESRSTREQPADGSSALDGIVKAMEAAGTPVSFTPLDEVADQVVAGILAGQFWMLEPSDQADESVRRRTQSILERNAPDYLLGRAAPRPPADDD
jgi:short-subunit dehydrogenase